MGSTAGISNREKVTGIPGRLTSSLLFTALSTTFTQIPPFWPTQSYLSQHLRQEILEVIRSWNVLREAKRLGLDHLEELEHIWSIEWDASVHECEQACTKGIYICRTAPAPHTPTTLSTRRTCIDKSHVQTRPASYRMSWDNNGGAVGEILLQAEVATTAPSRGLPQPQPCLESCLVWKPWFLELPSCYHKNRQQILHVSPLDA
jgi:hypothetical protein